MSRAHRTHASPLLALVVLAVFLAGCGDDAQGPSVAPAYVPTFEQVACWDGLTDPTITCGYVTVPENRDEPRGRQVRLAVARLASLAAEPGTPVIYFHGGPGGSTLSNLAGWSASALRDERELILLDQRGSGRSTPLLDCPERADVTWQTFSMVGDLDAERQLYLDATAACRERLVAEGADLTQYDTVANAKDVADIRIALGIDEWNLYGISYGTTLALEVMRSHPEGVRSVVLDATYPLDQGDSVEREALSADRSLQAMHDGCARDPSCVELMEGSFLDYLDATIAEFDAEPYELQGTDERTGITWDLKLDGADVFAGIFNAMYDAGLVAIMPTVVQQVRSRNPVFLQTAADDGINRINDLHEMAFIGIECRDRGHDWSLADTVALLAERPELSTLYNVFAQTFCEVAEVGTVQPRRNTPVVSDIPTLVMGGEFDPITPPAWGEAAAQHLSRGTYFEFPGIGHGSSPADPCPFSMMTAFLRDPGASPDGSCIAEMSVPFP